MNRQSPTRTLQHMAAQDRPQERLERLGAKALSDTELLAMLLRSGSKKIDVVSLASTLIRESDSLSGLLKYTQEDFQRHHGIGKVKALQLLTVMEIARRVLASHQQHSTICFDRPQMVYRYFEPITMGLGIEKFWTLSLNRKNRLLKCNEITSGTASHSLVHPREAYQQAIRAGASAIIAVHNHPSGDPSPSPQDIQATRRLREASKILDIDLRDHIIIGTPSNDPNAKGYYSFSEAGIL